MRLASIISFSSTRRLVVQVPSDFAQQQINYIYLYASCLSASMSVHYIIVRPKSICFVPKKKKHTHTAAETKCERQAEKNERLKRATRLKWQTVNGNGQNHNGSPVFGLFSADGFLLDAWDVCPKGCLVRLLIFLLFFFGFRSAVPSGASRQKKPTKKTKNKYSSNH